MSLKDQLQESQDNHRSKQLDTWESSLKEREALLDDTDKIAQLEVLDKQIDVKETRVADLQQKIEALEKDLRSYTVDHNEGVKTLELYMTRRKADSQEVDDLLNDKQKALQGAIDMLEAVNKEIQAQRKYLKDGQKQVDDTIAEWNVQLKEFQAEHNTIMKEKDTINADMVRLRQEKEILENELYSVEKNLVSQDEIYEKKTDEFKTELSEGKKALDLFNQRSIELDFEIKGRLQAIESKEEGIKLKERALESREFKLEQDEKGFRSKVGLA